MYEDMGNFGVLNVKEYKNVSYKKDILVFCYLVIFYLEW